MSNPDKKIADALIRALDKGEMNGPSVAFYISSASRTIQFHMWKIMLNLIEYWSYQYDIGGYDPEDEQWMATAAKFKDVIDQS